MRVNATHSEPLPGTSVTARWRGWTLSLLALALLFAGLGAPFASAQQVETDEINRERERREELRQQQVNLALFMDPLMAENDELEERVRVLDAAVATQQSRVAATQQAIAQAENEVLLANAAVGAKTLEIAALKEQLKAQAVEAYLAPPGNSSVSTLLTSEDITEAGRRQALIDTVGQREADILDALEGAEQALQDLVDDAEAAAVVVQEQQRAEAEQLVLAEQAVLDVEAARRDLAARVEEVQAHIDGFADAEAEVQAILNQLIAEETARLAEIERQRVAEEQARLAAERAAIEAERARVAALTAPPAVAAETGQATTAELVEAAPAPSPGASGMQWPGGGPVVSGFGPRWGRMHQGIDISMNQGSSLVAAQAGTVISTSVVGAYGNLLVISHGEGVTTHYAHMSSFGVSPGQTVAKGEYVGQSGGDPGTPGAGNSRGAHLHFEVRVNGTAYDPMSYLG